MRTRLLSMALLLAGCTAAPHARLSTSSAVTAQAAEGPAVNGSALVPSSLLLGAGQGILSEHGAGVVANNGAMVVGKVKFGLLATGQKPAIQFTVQVVDAGGKAVLDAAGKPYEAVTGEDGRFSLPRTPLGHNLLLKLALPGDAGQLLCLLQPGREAALEGVGTHVLGYVLDQYVAGQQAALDRPIGPAVDEAIAKAEAALTAVAGGKLDVKSLSTASVVATVGVWRDLSKDFDAQIRVVQQQVVN